MNSVCVCVCVVKEKLGDHLPHSIPCMLVTSPSHQQRDVTGPDLTNTHGPLRWIKLLVSSKFTESRAGQQRGIDWEGKYPTVRWLHYMNMLVNSQLGFLWFYFSEKNPWEVFCVERKLMQWSLWLSCVVGLSVCTCCSVAVDDSILWQLQNARNVCWFISAVISVPFMIHVSDQWRFVETSQLREILIYQLHGHKRQAAQWCLTVRLSVLVQIPAWMGSFCVEFAFSLFLVNWSL